MLSAAQKGRYLRSSLAKAVRGGGRACPSCGSGVSIVVDRKYLITTLRRCGSCSLMFRAPTTTAEEFAVFYQDDYSEGFTTDLPSQADLDLLKQGHFKDSGKDYGKYIGVLQALGCRPGQLLLDYGCSWGYGGWQFAEAGFRVIGFEVSEGRCRYAQDMLGVNAASTIDRLPMQGEFDVFFSSHVLEHIPNLGEVLLLARTIVKPGGLFVAFTPNAPMRAG